MLYMVEMDMPHAERLEQWHDWYIHHLQRLVAIPGILTAQRFGAEGLAASPYLAVYNIAEPGVLSSPAYLANAGPGSTGDWRPLMTNWYRNVVEGIDELPEIPMSGRIVVIDRLSPEAPPLPPGFCSLRSIGLDRSFYERGLLVGGRDPQPYTHPQMTWRVFRPLSARIAADFNA